MSRTVYPLCTESELACRLAAFLRRPLLHTLRDKSWCPRDDACTTPVYRLACVARRSEAFRGDLNTKPGTDPSESLCHISLFLGGFFQKNSKNFFLGRINVRAVLKYCSHSSVCSSLWRRGGLLSSPRGAGSSTIGGRTATPRVWSLQRKVSCPYRIGTVHTI